MKGPYGAPSTRRSIASKREDRTYPTDPRRRAPWGTVYTDLPLVPAHARPPKSRPLRFTSLTSSRLGCLGGVYKIEGIATCIVDPQLNFCPYHRHEVLHGSRFSDGAGWRRRRPRYYSFCGPDWDTNSRGLQRRVQAAGALFTPSGKSTRCASYSCRATDLASQHFMNDPNGMFLDANGTYHLYYQCKVAILPKFTSAFQRAL